MPNFDLYKDRNITFRDLIIIDDWAVKVYTISMNESFQSNAILNNCINHIEKWLETPKSSTLPVHNAAFLIVHEGREGVWILFNWWTGGEMIETQVFFASYDQPSIIKTSPHDGALICIWEMEVKTHESLAWTKHVLMKAQNPDINSYLEDHFVKNKEFA